MHPALVAVLFAGEFYVETLIAAAAMIVLGVFIVATVGFPVAYFAARRWENHTDDPE